MRIAPAAVALTAAAVGIEVAPVFSHRLHGKLMGCLECHPAAASSTRGTDRLLPSREACVKCHQNPSVPLHSPVVVVHFSHRDHLKTTSLAATVARAIDAGEYLAPAGAMRKDLDTANACTACHRGLAEPGIPARPPLARMADCLVCHNRIEPPDSCRQCHSPDDALKPASHTPDFLDSHTTGKLKLDKTSCAVCHGRRFTCLGCH